MFGRKARRERESNLQAEAERLIGEDGVGEALAVVVRRTYDVWNDPAAVSDAHALRSAIKRAAGLGSLDTSTRYLVLDKQERRRESRR